MNIRKVILIICTVLFSASFAVSAAGFEYGDNSGLPGLEQFAGNKYVIYQNADNGRIELAVIYADDINDRSLVVEIDGQVEVPESREADPNSATHTSPDSIKIIAPIEKKSIYISDTQNSYYTVKWYLNNQQWVKLTDMEENQAISVNYSELIYSDLPIMEKLYKEKTGRSYYRAYSGEYYVDFDWATRRNESGTEEYIYYAWFSKDGINVEKKVELEEMGNGGIGGAYTGNGKTIVMGVPNMALSEYQRPEGFNSGCIYIFNEDCDLISTEKVTGLQSCIGFYNNYFYFTTKTYVSKGESTVKYTKSADCINYIDITKEEFQEAIDSLNDPIHKTVSGNSVSFEYNEDETVRVYLSNADNEENREVVYESANKFERSDIAISSDLSGSIVRSKYRVNVLNNDKDYMTVDYVYKMCLPEIDQTKAANPNSRCIWATDDFVYIDQDVEYILRIPMSQFEDQVYVQLNDKILGFDQPPVTENDRTLVPMRFLFEQMGAEVTWDDATQTATATVPVTTEEEIQTFGLAEEKSVTFSVDNTTATVNGSTATMDVPARLINDKTMVPLRFLSENLGFDVSWDEASRTAIVTTE